LCSFNADLLNSNCTDLLLLTVLPLDRGEYSSEIGDCLKNSSFEATTIRHRQRFDVLIFFNILPSNVRADYWFRCGTHGRHAPTWLKPASHRDLDGIRKFNGESRCEIILAPAVAGVRRGLRAQP
jgi:hypothetical protein